MIKAVLFDVIGTTVEERDPSFINNCFMRAFLDNGISVTQSEIKSIRGMSKDQAIQTFVAKRGLHSSLSKTVLSAFHDRFASNIQNFSERPELPDIMVGLRKRNITVGVGTGLSGQLFHLLFNFLRWERYRFDFVGVADEVGAGRPDPKMLLLALAEFNLQPHELLKVGDTLADIEEGKNANVKTAVLLAGTQDEQTLRGANPDFVLSSLSELNTILHL